jgi:hypothetical protein
MKEHTEYDPCGISGGQNSKGVVVNIFTKLLIL